MSLVLVFVKLSTFMIRRDVVMQLIRYSEKNFWKIYYDDVGQQIMIECDAKGFTFFCTFFIFVTGTVGSYIIAPMVGKFILASDIKVFRNDRHGSIFQKISAGMKLTEICRLSCGLIYLQHLHHISKYSTSFR